MKCKKCKKTIHRDCIIVFEEYYHRGCEDDDIDLVAGELKVIEKYYDKKRKRTN